MVLRGISYVSNHIDYISSYLCCRAMALGFESAIHCQLYKLHKKMNVLSVEPNLILLGSATFLTHP